MYGIRSQNSGYPWKENSQGGSIIRHLDEWKHSVLYLCVGYMTTSN